LDDVSIYVFFCQAGALCAVWELYVCLHRIIASERSNGYKYPDTFLHSVENLFDAGLGKVDALAMCYLARGHVVVIMKPKNQPVPLGSVT
jgi:hypothetical protein